MRTPSTAALLVLASLCLEQTLATQHETLTRSKAKYQEACPAYEHYSRFAQYVLLHYDVLLPHLRPV